MAGQVVADSSIYSQLQAPDIVGSYFRGKQQGATLRQLANQQKEFEDQEKVKEALKAGVVQNPDGSFGIDRNKTLTGVASVNPQKAYELQEQFRTQDLATNKAKLEKQIQEIDFTGRLLSSVSDQNTYSSALQQAQSLGLDVSKLPTVYDPGLVRNLQYRALTTKERLDSEYKQFDQKIKEKELGLKEQELRIKRLEAKNKAASGDQLPLDKKNLVETLSTKNANKLAIKNQIQAVVDNWDGLSDEQKLIQGNQLLKTLNSSEGADAIGVEEAKRLGSMLEFQMLNFTRPGAFVGRDLEGFKQQAQNTANNIGSAVNSNQKIIDKAMGRQAPEAPTQSKPQVVVQNGHTYTLNPQTGEYE